MATLSDLTKSQDSTSKTPWGWIFSGILGIVILVVAAIVYWQIRRLAKKVSALEGEKIQLQSKVDDLNAQLKILPNDLKTQELLLQVQALQLEINDKTAKIASLKADADAKIKELEAAKPW